MSLRLTITESAEHQYGFGFVKKGLLFGATDYIFPSLVGAWRSLVAHLHGVQRVEGSNPFAPTIK